MLFENVRGLLDKRFDAFRNSIETWLRDLGYVTHTALLNAKDFGLPQKRPRVFIVGLKSQYARAFHMPEPQPPGLTVGDLLYPEMASGGWEGADAWRKTACGLAPAIAAGSVKHKGGADYSGGSSARKTWEKIDVSAKSVADHVPARGFTGLPRLTLRMCAQIQGFPDGWEFIGDKISQCRQIGNALPPPLAHAVAQAVAHALRPGRPRKFPK